MSKFFKEVKPFSFIENNVEKSLFPLPLRCLIVGASVSGKTTLLWNMITEYWVEYKHIYIFTKSLYQPIYIKLQEVFNEFDIELIISDQNIVSVDECKKSSLVVFDDFILEKQAKIKEYFVRDRPKDISCIYLSQNYSLVDPQLIRNNLNFLVVFKQSNYYSKNIWKDLVSNFLTLQKLQRMLGKRVPVYFFRYSQN